MKEPEQESIRMAMDQAWRDHHHARDQTWRAVQIEAVLAAGMVGVDFQLENVGATIAAGILVIIAAIFGIMISLHHRKLEIRKFNHILNCEEALGLHQPNLIDNVSLPSPITFWDIFRFRKMNTALFILRMHFAIIVFAVIFVVVRWLL
jgi:disulfide bond formation protein DsbB